MSVLFTLLLVSSLTIFSQCTDKYEWERYEFRKGSHAAKPLILDIDRDGILRFMAMFDSTCIYDIGKDQSDWNKLTGLYYLSSKGTHEYSVMVSWRWYNDSIELGYYMHLPDQPLPVKGYLKSIPLNSIMMCEVSIVDNINTVIVGNTSYSVESININKNTKWIVNPWFGGNKTAPHNIYIYLNYW